MSLMDSFSGSTSLELSRMQTETKISFKLTYLFQICFLDDAFCPICIKDHQGVPETFLVNIPIPANAK
jgi:hypothetical protein